MKGILIRDVLVLYKRYLRIPVVIISIAGLVFTLIMGFPISSLLSLILPIGIGALSTNLFAEDEKDNWLRQVKIMPVSDANVVCSRFIVFMGTVLTSSLYMLFLNAVSYLVHKDQTLTFYFIFTAMGFIVAVFNNFLLLPACYKFGAQGANIVSIGILISVGLLTVGIKKINIRYFMNIYETSPSYTIWLIAIVIFLITGILSGKLSIFFYKTSKVQ